MKISVFCLFLIVSTFIKCKNTKLSYHGKATETSSEQLPYLTYHKENLFPGTGGLLRVEDGVALDDGRIIVVDQAKGLRLIEKDGSNRPFGDFAKAGFVHNSPETIAAPNGLFLEPDGKHVLMCDVSDGKIYRTNLSSEKVALIHDHPYGINAIYCDKTGAIWFTQSAKSTNLVEMFSEVNLPVPNGAIFRMKDFKSIPVKLADSLYFANGITMDKDEKNLFVAETMMDRVLSYEADIIHGSIVYSGVAVNIGTPDNLLIKENGNLLVASPGYNRVVEANLKNHSQNDIFNASTKENQKITNEWSRRSHLGLARAELLTPALFSPLPGMVTGMFFSKDGRTLYIANLGNDLLKFTLK